MPNGDRTGPAGAGARTGRGMGYCSGNEAPGWQAGQGSGRGRGFHRGFRCNGRGSGFFRNSAAPAGRPSDETSTLREEMEALRMQVAALGRQLADDKE